MRLQSKEKAGLIARDLADYIDMVLGQEIRLAESMAADFEIVDAVAEGRYQFVQKKMEAVHQRIGASLYTYFLLDRDGIVKADSIFQREIGLDLSERQYFRKAIAGEVFVDGPLVSKAPSSVGEKLVIVSVPLRRGDENIGVIGILYNMEYILGILSRDQKNLSGFAYLTDAQGLVLAHPNKGYILKLQIANNPGSRELMQLIRSGEEGVASYEFLGTRYVAGVKHMTRAGWTVVFAQNWDEIMLPIRRILGTLFFSAMVFLLITMTIIITASNRISTPIQRMMAMMRQVTMHSRELILQIGLDHRILFANPEYEKVSGLKAEAIVGSEPDLENAAGIPPVEIWTSLEAGNSWTGRLLLKGGGANTLTLYVMLIPIMDDRGVVQGYLEIGRDITEELLSEKRLAQAQKLEAIGTLVGGIAHDFNNILSGIMGYAELTLLRKDSPADTEKSIRQIIKASERARDLIGQILTFSRQSEVELRPIQPKTILKEVLKLMRASIPTSVRIEVELNSESSILAEPTQIHQLVMNLFTNAVHAIGENSGTITLELNDRMVDEEFCRLHPGLQPGRYVHLRVTDTGSGIESHVLDHIFDPFFTTKPHGEGTGLGLSMVHGIVKKLQGAVTVYSDVGKGTVFNIFIPCRDSAADEVEPLPERIRRGTERIAVVDDEEAIVSSIQSILVYYGYRVTIFSDSLEALRVITESPGEFDLMITDYSMPNLSGLEIAATLKKRGISLPVILMSGFIGKEVETAAREKGIIEIMVKPISAYQLAEAIGRILSPGG